MLGQFLDPVFGWLFGTGHSYRLAAGNARTKRFLRACQGCRTLAPEQMRPAATPWPPVRVRGGASAAPPASSCCWGQGVDAQIRWSAHGLRLRHRQAEACRRGHCSRVQSSTSSATDVQSCQASSTERGTGPRMQRLGADMPLVSGSDTDSSSKSGRRTATPLFCVLSR